MNATASATRSDESSLVARLSLEQKVRLLTGADAWSLYAIDTVGLRGMVVSDGPSGVRGRRFDPGNPRPRCHVPVALGATWDERLVGELALALGVEARSEGWTCCSLPRSTSSEPSERAWLRVLLRRPGAHGAHRGGVRARRAGVRGRCNRQSISSPTTPKPTGERTTLGSASRCCASSTSRRLRRASFDADVAVVMAAYNSVNGHTMTANRTIAHGSAQGRVGIEGVVVSDWSATRTTEPTAARRPGPWRCPDRAGRGATSSLPRCSPARCPKSDRRHKVARLLRLARRVGALDGAPEHAPA